MLRCHCTSSGGRRYIRRAVPESLGCSCGIGPNQCGRWSDFFVSHRSSQANPDTDEQWDRQEGCNNQCQAQAHLLAALVRAQQRRVLACSCPASVRGFIGHPQQLIIAGRAALVRQDDEPSPGGHEVRAVGVAPRRRGTKTNVHASEQRSDAQELFARHDVDGNGCHRP